jgi:hypothetical protein
VAEHGGPPAPKQRCLEEIQQSDVVDTWKENQLPTKLNRQRHAALIWYHFISDHTTQNYFTYHNDHIINSHHIEEEPVVPKSSHVHGWFLVQCICRSIQWNMSTAGGGPCAVKATSLCADSTQCRVDCWATTPGWRAWRHHRLDGEDNGWGQCWGDQRCNGDETRQLPSLFRPKGAALGRSQVGAASGRSEVGVGA